MYAQQKEDKVEPKKHELAPGGTDQNPRHFLSSLTLMVWRPYASYGPRHGAKRTPWAAVGQPQEGPGVCVGDRCRPDRRLRPPK